MKILNSSFSVIFPPFFNVREMLFELERSLSDDFATPFTLVPIPSEAPPEIPRITATTKKGHSSLAITLNSAQFTTNYDDNFAQDTSKCIAYIEKYFERIYNTFSSKLFATIQFCGLTINVQHQLADGMSSTAKLNTGFLKLVTESTLHDALIKYTFTKDDTYYVNLQLQNQRIVSNQLFQGILGKVEHTDLLLITLDVNDRFALNYKPGYESGYEKMKSILAMTAQYLNSDVPDLIETGRFDV